MEREEEEEIERVRSDNNKEREGLYDRGAERRRRARRTEGERAFMRSVARS